MLVSKNPYVVEARQNLTSKNPHFALKTGKKFAQAFGLTVRSPIMKIWVLLFIKSRRYDVECYRLQIIVILDLLNIQTRCQTYKTRNCRKIEASQKIILNFAVSKVSNKFSFLKYTFWNTIERRGKTRLLQITARQSSFTQQRTAIPNLK